MSFRFATLSEIDDRIKPNCDAWDSYFTHRCVLGLDVDVLISDIDERKSFVCVRRWWHNLFLVSFNIDHFNSSCISSCAIGGERVRQFRSYGFRIHPFSPFKRVWDKLMFAVTMLNVCSITLLTSCIYVTRDSNLHHVCVTITIALELIVITDIYLNFKTGCTVKNSRYVEFDQAWISMNYLATTILVHFVSAIPWLIVLKATGQLAVESENPDVRLCTTYQSVVCVASLGRLARLLEMIFFRRPRCARPSGRSLTNNCVLMLLVGFMLLHLLTCLHLAATVIIASFGGRPVKLAPVHRLGIYIQKQCDPFELYVRGFQKAAQMFFSTHNYIGHPGTNMADKIVFMTTLSISWLFYMWVVIEIMAVLRRQHYSGNFVLKHLHRALNMVTARALPDRLERHVRAHFAAGAVREDAALWGDTMFSVLPLKMRNEMTVAMHRALLLRVPPFRRWPAEVLEEMALRLKGETLLPGDVIVTDALGSGRLYIVESGRLKLWTSEEGSEWSEVGEGSYFTCRRGVALEVCSLRYLDLAETRRLLRSTPDLLDQFTAFVAQ